MNDNFYKDSFELYYVSMEQNLAILTLIVKWVCWSKDDSKCLYSGQGQLISSRFVNKAMVGFIYILDSSSLAKLVCKTIAQMATQMIN